MQFQSTPLRFNRAKGVLILKLLTVVLIVIGSNAVGGRAEAATVNVPLKCNANVEFYADIYDTINFQWVDPDTGVKWSDSSCSDDGTVQQNTIYNASDSASASSYCQPSAIRGFLRSATNEEGCWWRYYRRDATPNAQFDRDNVPTVLLPQNQGAVLLAEGTVVAEQWIDFSDQNSAHYDIIWRGPTANAPAPASDMPSVPVPTLSTILLMILSGLLALFGFSRIRASK